MACSSCSRRTLSLFIESITSTRPIYVSRPTPFRQLQTSRFSSFARQSQEAQDTVSAPAKPTDVPKTSTQSPELAKAKAKAYAAHSKPKSGNAKRDATRDTKTEFRTERKPQLPKEKEPWQKHKEAIKAKIGDATWNPRKKVSPDTMEGIRHLHHTQPTRFTTAVLAKHFQISPEAVRRILKSKWRPNEDEEEERLRRWDKRGERIWSNLVEMGVKPPKKWREMGVGRAAPGQKPKWKGMARNRVEVNDGWKDYEEAGGFASEEDIIPTVDGTTGASLEQRKKMTNSLLGRL